jgi:hypothetical protein
MVFSPDDDFMNDGLRVISENGNQFRLEENHLLNTLSRLRKTAMRAIRNAIPFLAFVMTLSALSHTCFAQTIDTATMRGAVVDQNKAAITGAQVAVTNEQTGLRRETRTDESGNYTIASLPLTGKYKLAIFKSGFAGKEVNDIELRAGEAASLDITLVPQGSTGEVIVLGTTEGVQSDSSQLGTRLDLQKIDNTPIFGRKITNLVQLNSAVRPARGTGDLFLNNFLFIVNGSGRRQTSFTLDGSTDNDSWGRQTLFTNIPLSALQEFTVLTNAASAEYGRTTGSVVNIVTKSGTNDFHTDFVALARPGGSQARSPLAQQRTIDRLVQLSGVVSGPISKDRTHFLAGAEYNNQRRDSVITSPLAPGLYTGTYQQGLFFARLDHQLNERNSLTARAGFDRFTDTNPADAVGGNNLPSAARLFKRRTYSAQLAETAAINSTTVNEARLQFQLASPITQFQPVHPSMQFVRPGLATEGESRSASLINHQYQFADTLLLTRGRHNIKLGGDVIFSSSGGNGQEFGAGFVLGQFTLKPGVTAPVSQLTSADLPRVVQRFTQSFGNANYRVREYLYSFFTQDDWRVRRDLVLNLGVRYERQTFTDDKNNFAPRVGFAYNFRGDARTVLRGSYGIYYSELRANLGAQFALNGPTGVFTFSAAPGQLGFPTSFAPLPIFPPGAILPPRDIVIRPGRASYYDQFFKASKLRGYPDKLLNPYTQQATFGIERELPGKVFLSADYVYAHTIRIDRTLDLNAPSLFIPTLTKPTRSAAEADLTRPILPLPNGFRRIQVVVNNGDSLYNGLQVNLEKRFSRNFSLLASYTYSHTINTVEPDAPSTDPSDVNLLGRFERGNSLLDQRHRAVISGYYQLPLNFIFGGVATLASGRPYNITVGTDVNGDGSTADRPFDFTTGTFVGRDTGRGTPVYDTSVFIERDFALSERVYVGVRAESFNIFNHPNIVARNGVISQSTFGQGIGGINGVDPGREFQFQLRLRY